MRLSFMWISQKITHADIFLKYRHATLGPAIVKQLCVQGFSTQLTATCHLRLSQAVWDTMLQQYGPIYVQCSSSFVKLTHLLQCCISFPTDRQHNIKTKTTSTSCQQKPMHLDLKLWHRSSLKAGMGKVPQMPLVEHWKERPIACLMQGMISRMQKKLYDVPVQRFMRSNNIRQPWADWSYGLAFTRQPQTNTTYNEAAPTTCRILWFSLIQNSQLLLYQTDAMQLIQCSKKGFSTDTPSASASRAEPVLCCSRCVYSRDNRESRYGTCNHLAT